ncbi:putative MFS transporter [Aspergillus saccharolyticus JOP 1030-1]|uniref:MFS general substrate transporter n=1 Tax=Aspergillus saccharolyticus JOP 1030-1 TaxID=1450539 RepID=A0A318ZQW4_9EURO|nr:MFS general substrate transporter [Aspergillus saccharolyticus JOP 1030-1]PYH46753.1 MFS general substrate transporter [Aspergillus saccharolyticus JOP 1030-1]
MSLAESAPHHPGGVKQPNTESIHERSLESREDDHDPETGSEPESEADIAEIERIYRKLDWRIIPAFWVLYFLCAAVRSNVGLAQTMNESSGHDLGSVLNMTPHQISTALALFYVCYVIFDLPSNLIMTRLSPHVWMSRIVISVGIIGSCMTAMKAAWSLYLLRLLLGIVIAGMWPGMTYYLTLFYPPSRTGKRIGQYYTAAQVSAAVVGLVSAGFQEMDGERGLVGFQWMFLVYGVITTVVGVLLLWWLPDRPLAPGAEPKKRKYLWWLPRSPPALTGRDAEIHYQDLKRVYHRAQWTWRDLLNVFLDWRLWPLLIMYFGVVGVGIGTQSYATVIIQSINPSLSGIDLSLLTAPIWIMDLIAILLVTPISDRFHRHRSVFFSVPVLLQILGLLLTTYAGTASNSWPRYGGLLIVGFGLGPTVPITMTWTTEIFQPRHGEVGVAAASAVVSGLGNLGSIMTTYALYAGWKSDYEAPGRAKYRKSNLVMVGILCASILAAITMEVLLRVVDGKNGRSHKAETDNAAGAAVVMDGAARREARQRGLDGLGSSLFKVFKRG